MNTQQVVDDDMPYDPALKVRHCQHCDIIEYEAEGQPCVEYANPVPGMYEEINHSSHLFAESAE